MQITYRKLKPRELHTMYKMFGFDKLVGYDVFKEICSHRKVSNMVWEADAKPIAFISYQYRLDAYMFFIHYFGTNARLDIKKEILDFIYHTKLFVIYVCYYRYKKSKSYCYKLNYHKEEK